MQKNIRSISIAGAGNVAWHLALGLSGKGYHIKGIWSRYTPNAEKLALACGAGVCMDLTELRQKTDLILIAVSDNAIPSVASGIGPFEGIVAHTAGSVSADTLQAYFTAYGVLYPLQTFTKEVPVNLEEVPFFTEGSSLETEQAISHVARQISAKVYNADSHQRLMLHIAAVFAGNYSNLMYVIADEILNGTGLPQEALHPLIRETARKAINADPKLVQTGPARRNDTHSIQKHINALASLPEYAELYQLLAQLIQTRYQ